MIKEFKEFIDRGNVVDLAVAVVIGAAFAAVVDSFTNDLLMQLLAAIGGEPDFSSLSFTLNDAEIRYGSFLTAMVSFLIVAFAVFLVVKALNAAQTIRAREVTTEEEAAPSETDLLAEIRDLLRERA